MLCTVNVLFLDLSGGCSGVHLIITVIVILYGLSTSKYLSYGSHQKYFLRKLARHTEMELSWLHFKHCVSQVAGKIFWGKVKRFILPLATLYTQLFTLLLTQQSLPLQSTSPDWKAWS